MQGCMLLRAFKHCNTTMHLFITDNSHNAVTTEGCCWWIHYFPTDVYHGLFLCMHGVSTDANTPLFRDSQKHHLKIQFFCLNTSGHSKLWTNVVSCKQKITWICCHLFMHLVKKTGTTRQLSTFCPHHYYTIWGNILKEKLPWLFLVLFRDHSSGTG